MPRLRLKTVTRLLLAVGLGLALLGGFAYTRIGKGRAFKVNATYPTETKPQSKLWYAENRWWAWLPDGEGSSLWQRVDKNWQRDASLDSWLQGVPGNADVWAEDHLACAVLNGQQGLTVAQLIYDDAHRNWRPRGYVTLPPDYNGSAPDGQASQDRLIECATITRDGHDHWWIAYDHDDAIWIRRSRDSNAAVWEEPIAIASGIDDDDLCTIFNTPDGVGVAWTNQIRDGVFFRAHENGKPSEEWLPIETIVQGERVANNHLSAAVTNDGAVYLVTKSRRYEIGAPLLSLHARTPTGVWTSHSFAKYDGKKTPTRPIVLLTADEQRIWLTYTELDNSIFNQHRIVARQINRNSFENSTSKMEVISPCLDLRNASSCKQALTDKEEGIILASDRWGNVFEGQLPQFSAAE